ncbi:MAG: gamma-glutamyl-gamma-aminobutyrate hydrolase family protein [Acutalibacteraceae bacterium]
MHNYRITHPARSLTVAGRTDDGTIEALEYGEQMLGVQFHPEADDQNDELFRAIL